MSAHVSMRPCFARDAVAVGPAHLGPVADAHAPRPLRRQRDAQPERRPPRPGRFSSTCRPIYLVRRRLPLLTIRRTGRSVLTLEPPADPASSYRDRHRSRVPVDRRSWRPARDRVHQQTRRHRGHCSCVSSCACLVPAPGLSPTGVAAGPAAATFQLPTVSSPRRRSRPTADAAGERDRGVTARRCATPACDDRERRGDLRAEHVLHRVHGAEAEQPAVPRHRRRARPTRPSRRTSTACRSSTPTRRASICMDVGQVEFVRGPQSALFGRNTLGGVDQRHQRAAVAVGLDRQPLGAARATSCARGARQRLRAGRGRQARRRRSPCSTASATATP